MPKPRRHLTGEWVRDLAMVLPRLILIADRFTQPKVAARTQEAVEAGVEWVHLRDHASPQTQFEDCALSLGNVLLKQNPALRISVNTRVSVAAQTGWGVHVGGHGPSVRAVRQAMPKHVLGFSAHDVEEGAQAAGAGVDYLFFSPVFQTASKPSALGKGVAALGQMCNTVPKTPVFALGGITPKRVKLCIEHGAYGIAVLSGVLGALRVSQAVTAYQQSLAKAFEHKTPEV